MRRSSAIILGISSLFLALFSVGCGSSAPAITITLAPSVAQTIDQGQGVNVMASLANDTGSKGVSWSLSGVGTLANQTPGSVTYQAPPTVSTRSTATLTATSIAQTAVTATLTITINPAPAITTTSLPSGTAGTAYSATLNESGGTAPLTWGVISGQLPPGLTLNAGGGAITGTPNSPGTFNFTVQLSDSANLSAMAALSIVIANPPALTPTTTTLPNGAVNVDYTAVLGATGGVAPYTWSVVQGSGNLPAGVQLGASGVISGTPTATGPASFTVQVKDSQTPTANVATQPLSIIINPVPFSITTTSLPNGTVTIAYSTTLQVSGGTAPYTWSISSGSLPTWATLNTATGVISGTPTDSDTGTTNFTVEVMDSESPTRAVATQPLSITVTGTNDALLSGQYAFAVSGYRGGLVGSFTTDGKGSITGGAEDLEIGSTLTGATDVAISSGTYAVGTDARGILSFTDMNGNSFSFDLALSPLSTTVAKKGAMIETDASGNNFTGFLYLQNTSAFSTSAMSGSYVFDLAGWDGSGKSDVVLGSGAVSSGAVSSGLLDENDNGTPASNQSFTGTLSSIDASGRGTLASSQAQANFTFYVVSATEWVAIASDSTTGAVRTGLVQQQEPGVYTDSSVSGTMVFESASGTSAPAPQAEVGLLTSTGSGTGNFSFDIDAGGTVGTETGTATLTFGANGGRFTLSLQATAGTSDYVGYMLAPNQAVIAGTDSIPSLGSFEQQLSGAFTATSLDGSYFVGSQAPVVMPAASLALVISSGEMNFDGTGVLSGTLDAQQAGTVTTSQLTGSYTVASTGRVTLVPGIAILYVVNSTSAVALYVGQASSPNPLIQFVGR